MYANPRMNKSMRPIVPDHGCTEYQTVGSRRGAKTPKNGPPGRCIQQQQNARQANHRVPEAPNGGRPDAIVYSDRDTIVGQELVRQYYTVLHNAPEHLWRFYAERAQYCHVFSNGSRVAANGLPQVRGLLESTAEEVRGRGPAIVESVNTIRCAPDQLLVMVTSEQFVQSFVVWIKTSRTFTVVASIVRDAFTARPPSPPAAEVRGTETDRGVVKGRTSSDDRQLFVGHLLSSTTSEHLRRKFAEYGEVVNVRIMSGYNRTGRPAMFNYGFVTFSKPDGVDAALASQPIKLSNGNKVNVKRTNDRRRLVA